jgi:hypothetical protein
MDLVASFSDISPERRQQAERNCDARHNPDSEVRRKIEAGWINSKGLFDINTTNDLIEFNFKPTSRTIIVKNNSVSSLSSKNTNKICEELKKMIGSTMKILVNNKIKIAKLKKVKNVEKNGKKLIQMKAESKDFIATGKFSENALDLYEPPRTSSLATIDFFGPTRSCNVCAE